MKSELNYKTTTTTKHFTVGGCAHIHCNSTPSTVVTWCEMGPLGKRNIILIWLIISPPTCILVNAVISQRIAQTICFSCKIVTEVLMAVLHHSCRSTLVTNPLVAAGVRLLNHSS